MTATSKTTSPLKQYKKLGIKFLTLRRNPCSSRRGTAVYDQCLELSDKMTELWLAMSEEEVEAAKLWWKKMTGRFGIPNPEERAD